MSNYIVALFSSVVTALLTIFVGLFVFSYQQRHQKKLQVYDECMKNLSTIAKCAAQIGLMPGLRDEKESIIDEEEENIYEIFDAVTEMSAGLSIMKIYLPMETARSISKHNKTITELMAIPNTSEEQDIKKLNSITVTNYMTVATLTALMLDRIGNEVKLENSPIKKMHCNLKNLYRKFRK